MNKEQRLKYIDIGLRVCNIEIHKDLLEKVIAVVDLVDKKEGKTSTKDLINIKNQLCKTKDAQETPQD